MSYHEHNKEVSGKKILEKLEEGKTVALVSDAGMPCISDQGYDIVVEAVAEQYHVIPLRANAALTALIASGLQTKQFYFYGFYKEIKRKEKWS